MNPMIITVTCATITFAIGLVLGHRLRGGARRPAAAASATEPGQGVELYVGNLPYDMKDRDVVRAFEKHGAVLSIRVIKNKFNGRSRGYGFIEMADDAAAARAVKSMNGFDMKGRKLVVNEAKSRSRDDD